MNLTTLTDFPRETGQLPKSPLVFADPLSSAAGKFDRDVFLVRHSLHLHPMFELEELIELARSLKRNIYYDAGEVGIDDRWDAMPDRRESPEEALGQIEQGKTWLVIKNAQQSPRYGEILNECLVCAEQLVARPFRREMRVQEMIVFVTSPRRIATYHIDRECSFLLQVRGEKTIHIFDGKDRDVLTEEEIETFWTVDNNAPRYRPDLQGRAKSFVLKPGDAIHIPVNWPHWVENHDNVSISVNINIQFADSQRADVYRANHFLRRFGLKPTPPNHSKSTDLVKAKTYSALRRCARLAGKQLP